MWPNVVDAKEVINGSVLIPQSAGIYAWYRRLSLDETSESNFIESIENILSGHTWPMMTGDKGRVGPYRAEINLTQHVRSLSDSKKAIADAIAADPRKRALLSRLVLQASVLQPPLYVGQAQALGTRISDHLRGRSQFTEFLGSTFEASQMVIAYIETVGLPPGAQLLLEAVAGTAAMPRYAGRVG